MRSRIAAALLIAFCTTGARAQTVDEVIAATFNDTDVLRSFVAFAIEEERNAPVRTFVHYTKRIEVNMPLDEALFRMRS